MMKNSAKTLARITEKEVAQAFVKKAKGRGGEGRSTGFSLSPFADPGAAKVSPFRWK